MKKVKWVVFSSVVLFLFLPGRATGEEIGILPFRTIGVESYITESFYDFLELELDYYDHNVISPYEIEDYLGHRVICYNKDYAADYGRSLGLEKVIFGSITKLGERYIISATVVKSRTGEILLRDKMTAETEDHFDACVYRLAVSIEEEVYGNYISCRPHCTRTHTHVYIGGCWRPRRVVRRRRPHRSLITVRVPLINIDLGRPHKVARRRTPKREPRYERPRNRRPRHGKPKKGKDGRKKSKDKKPRRDRDRAHRNRGKRRS